MSEIVELERTCRLCKNTYKIKVKDDYLFEYATGELSVDDCFSDAKEEDRELLKTGICGNCWKRIDKGEVK